MPASGQLPDNLTPAGRLRLLLDAAELERGHEVTFPQITEHLAERGVRLSRARWSYLVNGHRQTDDVELLTALAEFFGVDPYFLISGGGIPEKVASQIGLVRAMRAARVQNFAARALGELSPGAVDAITRFLDEHIAAENAASEGGR